MDCIAKPSEPPLILVVDDDRFMRYQLHHIMAEEGYRVEEANNGKEGIEAYQTLKPDIVLMDAIMPVMDGFACCQQLRNSVTEQTQLGQPPIHPPILMITSLDDQQSVDMAFASGADDYVTKPIHWAVLRQRVKRLIYQHQLHRELHDANQKLAEANFALERLASLDGLTQVANRRRFDQCFQYEWQRLARDQQYLSLILSDIDYFKAYNDTYGHQAGDRCLYQVAQAIQRATKRPADLVARYGGEEFAIVLPNTLAKGAIHVAQQIRSNVKQLSIDHALSPLDRQISLSFGVATMIPNHHQSPADLLSIADQALYQAKASGRDCICLATS